MVFRRILLNKLCSRSARSGPASGRSRAHRRCLLWRRVYFLLHAVRIQESARTRKNADMRGLCIAAIDTSGNDDRKRVHPHTHTQTHRYYRRANEPKLNMVALPRVPLRYSRCFFNRKHTTNYTHVRQDARAAFMRRCRAYSQQAPEPLAQTAHTTQSE